VGYTHVLITRPEAESRQLAALLGRAPLTPVVIAPYRFESLDAGAELAQAWPAAQRRLAVFTSTRAVQFGLRQLPDGFLQQAEIAAIGPATAAALERAGQPVSIVPEGRYTSETLLTHPELARDPGRALIFAAPGGRELLQQGLERLGWQVRVVFVYCRQPVAPGPEQVEALLGAEGIISVWTSENAMRALAEQLPAEAWQAVCRGQGIVTSERLGQCLRELGPARVRVSSGPDNESILQLILDLT
jgi:uroporphyrinogen-III synthase